MGLDTRRSALWHAMELGPVWTERVPVALAAPAGTLPAPEESAPVAAYRPDWKQLEADVAGCTACSLCRTRTQTVFGVGHRRAHWMIVGEAPGAEEDARGEPFVGQAGKLLDNMLASVGLGRHADEAGQAVFIANTLK